MACTLKTKPEKDFFVRRHFASLCLAGAGSGGKIDQGIEQLFDAEVIDGAAEEDRRLVALEIFIQVKRVGRTFEKFDVLTQFISGAAEQLIKLTVVDVLDNADIFIGPLAARPEKTQLLAIEVVNPLKALAHADRPGHRRALDLQLVFNIGEQVEWILPFSVHFIDKSQYRGVSHATDCHQLFGLRLNPLGAVDHHQGAVYGGQNPIGVLGKVLVTRRIEQVDFTVAMPELHHRCGHGDAALLLDLHPVAGRVTACFSRLDRPGHLDGAAKQQQFFGQGGFTGIRMADNAKCSAFCYFLQ